MPRDPERFIALVCKELGAASAKLVELAELAEPGPAASQDDDPRTVACDIDGGHRVVATFTEVPADRDAKKRRLEMLAAAFDAVAVETPSEGSSAAISDHPTRRTRPPAAMSLRDELALLCEKAGALNALVVDANSPVVWGAAHPAGLAEVPPLPSSPTLGGTAAGAASAGTEDGDPPSGPASRRALRVVRGLPELAALRKGKPLRYVERSGEGPLITHAFASIYLLVVVFEPSKSFDELRAERAIAHSLPRVERLVMALPPHEPDPTQGAGVVAMRRPQRRR